MNSKELPEKYKHYLIILSKGDDHLINGETKKNILMAESQFVELEDGNCINKSYIVQFKFDHGSTLDFFNRLPQVEKNLISK